MNETLTLLEFQSPWRGGTGFRRFELNTATGRITPAKRVKPKKLMRKGKGGIDGLILRPTWPTFRSLCILPVENSLRLYDVKGGRIDVGNDYIDISDPEFSAQVSERLLYRSFQFETDTHQIEFADLEGRIFGPERTSFEIFPANDFSPFARLIRILEAPAERQKLIDDLQNRKFEYPQWVKPSLRRQGARAEPQLN